LFSNVTEADILLREEFDALKEKYPDTLDVVYVLDKPDSKWQGEPSGVLKYPAILISMIPGPSGFINADLVKKHVAPASLKEKVKIFVCGILFSPSTDRLTM
jgi:cytochrome-b5 reductase